MLTWPQITVCSTTAEGADQPAAVSGVPSQQPLNSPAVPHQGKALGNPVTLLIQPLSSFSLPSQAEDDKSCWCHHQLQAGTMLRPWQGPTTDQTTGRGLHTASRQGWSETRGYPTPCAECCSVRRTYRSECQCWVKGVAPDNFDPKFRKQQPCSSTTHRFISCNIVFTPDEEGGPVISSRKCGKPRALCSRVQLQVPLDCSRSTLNNHNLAGKKEKELGSQSAMSNEEEAKSAVSTSHCLWEQVSDT